MSKLSGSHKGTLSAIHNSLISCVKFRPSRGTYGVREYVAEAGAIYSLFLTSNVSRQAIHLILAFHSTSYRQVDLSLTPGYAPQTLCNAFAIKP